MSDYDDLFASLTDAQRQAVTWQEGSLLVLAGPGSGKTRVLTTRIARLINETPDKAFRVLALTFTNKAADEMHSRVQTACDAPDRAVIGTFHSFCMQMLQQHGSHIDIRSDFTIYSLDADRKELLRDGLRRSGASPEEESSLVKYLQLIDRLKSSLVDVDDAAGKFADPTAGANAARVYGIYEAELSRANALDFNSLVLRAYQLVTKFAGIAQTYRRTYKYWLVDEFQDTNRAQYRFLKALAGDDFKNIFTVADDDQIIYQWNGASFQQMQRFRADFQPELIQLPTNYRCPPRIVAIANSLVRHNIARTESKLPLLAGKQNNSVPEDESLLVGGYDTPELEAEAVAEMISGKPVPQRRETVVIARTRALLDGVKTSLERRGIKAHLAQRRDEFLSPQYCWLNSLLRQVARKQDARNFGQLVGSYNKWRGASLSPEMITAQAEASGRSLLDEWIVEACKSGVDDCHELVRAAGALTQESSSYRPFIEKAVAVFKDSGTDSDLEEDAQAWKALDRSIASAYGRNLALDQYLQHIALQSKDPPAPADAVTLMTIHGAKGKEYDFVFLIGLAEDTLPSFHSLKAGDSSPELEEERRNCFVAITRVKEQLVLTYARSSRGYKKKPSRFFAEMGISPP